MADIESNSVLVSYNGIEVYPDDIAILCDEYINNLPNPEIIYKSAGFCGLLEYIYSRKLKHVVINKPGKGYDFTVLDNIFYNIYLPLCYRYNITPTVIQFTALARIDNTHLGDIKNGVYSSNGSRVNPAHMRTVKNWFNACESALLGRAVNDNGIGAIFALKANYGYRETAPSQEPQAIEAHESAEQIAARHSAARLPEKPILED